LQIITHFHARSNGHGYRTSFQILLQRQFLQQRYEEQSEMLGGIQELSQIQTNNDEAMKKEFEQICLQTVSQGSINDTHTKALETTNGAVSSVESALKGVSESVSVQATNIEEHVESISSLDKRISEEDCFGSGNGASDPDQ